MSNRNTLHELFEVLDVPAKPRRKRAPKADRESTVLKECLAWLRRAGIFAWRNNTGAFALSDGGYIAFGSKGGPDIIGMLPDGTFLGIECKSRIGKQTPDQEFFEMRVREHQGIYLLIHSLAELKSKLHDEISHDASMFSLDKFIHES